MKYLMLLFLLGCGVSQHEKMLMIQKAKNFCSCRKELTYLRFLGDAVVFICGDGSTVFFDQQTYLQKCGDKNETKN